MSIRSLSTVLALAACAVHAQTPAHLPRSPTDGPALRFDFPSLEIGIAEYEDGPTGTTVFHFTKPVIATVDVRGGAPGTMMTDFLSRGYDTPLLDALVFTGGSLYGLASVSGVADELRSRAPDNGRFDEVKGVAGAVIFDLYGRRFNTIAPDAELGRAALRAAVPGRFPLGARGAGRFAMQGWYLGDPQHSGQGAAFRQIGPTKILVFTVVNAYGSVVDRGGRMVRCTRRAADGCPLFAQRLGDSLARIAQAPVTSGGASGASEESAPQGAAVTANTTLTLVVTNQRLPMWALQRLAVQVHTSMARAIQPFSTSQDGDALFAVTTAEIDNPKLSAIDLGVAAGETAWDAVLASVPVLDSAPPATAMHLEPAALDAYAGTYAMSSIASATLRRDGDRLMVQATNRGGMYLPTTSAVALVPVARDEFVLATPRAERVRFERDGAGRVAALVIAPGQWPIRAVRQR